MRLAFVLGIVITVITLTTYWQVGNHDFLNLDDNWFITDNTHVATGLSKDNILWAFTPVPDMGWFPLAWLSHMVDVELYGLDPRGHHLTNVAWHIAATLLLFVLLFRTTQAPWPSAFVATLFALHPAHVESVAWVAERRDVLCAFFGFLSLLTYAEYVSRRQITFYLSSLISFLLGLMSKPMLVTFPLVMLLLDYWPLYRYNRAAAAPGTQPQKILARAVREKIPFFACSLLSIAFTLSTPTLEEIVRIPSSIRLANATTAYLKYLGKLLWPTDLAVFYPLPETIPAWQTIASILFLLVATVTVIRSGRRHPYVVTGWFWYLITLLPVLGLVQISTYAIADRYTYLPAVGLFIVVAWTIPAVCAKLPYQREFMPLLAVFVIVTSTIVTWRQLGYWQNNITLYEHALRVTPGNILAHNNLGLSLAEDGRLDEAIAEFKKAVTLRPDFVEGYNNLGLTLAEKGALDEAIREYGNALAKRPNYLEALNNLGIAYKRKRDFTAAIRTYQRALEISPESYQVYNNLGVALQAAGSIDEAIEHYQKAIALEPDYDDARYNLNLALKRRAGAQGIP
jgi:tetratricopeptide (TPR) repeat protein